MRMLVAGALLLLVLLTMPVTALAATPAPAWPSAKDLEKQPGVRARDAVCIARYYHGRLSRRAWFTPYWNLTAAEKIVTDAGTEHCMTPAQRVAWAERFYAVLAGKLPEVHCTAVRSEAQSRAERLAITSRAKWVRRYEAIFRACGLTGAVYGEVAATQLHLPTTVAERSCANRIGNATLLMYKSPGSTTSKRTTIGKVYDRCVGAMSEAAMYRYLYRNYEFPAKIPCIARRLAAALTLVVYTTDAKKTNAAAHEAVAACLAGA